MFCVLVCFIGLSMARIALLQGSLPRFSQQDNPAAFHSSFQVRLLTFLYLSAFNTWLLLCPSQLSHDWQMGSIPLIMSFRDTRNILTLVTFCLILLIIYKIYNDLEVNDAFIASSCWLFGEKFRMAINFRLPLTFPRRKARLGDNIPERVITMVKSGGGRLN
jgi:hypothetical protein